jgi:hypothetical protein
MALVLTTQIWWREQWTINANIGKANFWNPTSGTAGSYSYKERNGKHMLWNEEDW